MQNFLLIGLNVYFWQSVMFSQSSEQLSASVFVVADKYNKPLRLFPKFENRLNAYVSQTGNVMFCSVLPSAIERQRNLGVKTTKGCFSISNSFLDKFHQTDFSQMSHSLEMHSVNLL